MSCRRFVRASTRPAAKAPTIGADSAFLAPQATKTAKATAAAPSMPRTLDLPTTWIRRLADRRADDHRHDEKADGHARSDFSAAPADSVPVWASLLTIASTTSPRTSSITAAPRMIWPSGVFRTPSSDRTRAVMPIDVAVSAAPTKIAVSVG